MESRGICVGKLDGRVLVVAGWLNVGLFVVPLCHGLSNDALRSLVWVNALSQAGRLAPEEQLRLRRESADAQQRSQA